VAAADDQSKFVRYNLKTKKWLDLVRSPDKFVNWEVSPDMKYFIYSTGVKNPTAFRLRLSDGVVETIDSLKDVHSVDEVGSGPSLGTCPDDRVPRIEPGKDLAFLFQIDMTCAHRAAGARNILPHPKHTLQ
jgi:hypothetical protein